MIVFCREQVKKPEKTYEKRLKDGKKVKRRKHYGRNYDY